MIHKNEPRPIASFILIVLLCLYPGYEVIHSKRYLEGEQKIIYENVEAVKFSWEQYLSVLDDVKILQSNSDLLAIIEYGKQINFTSKSHLSWQKEVVEVYKRIFIELNRYNGYGTEVKQFIGPYQNQFRLNLLRYNEKVKSYQKIKKSGFNAVVNALFAHQPDWLLAEAL